MKRLIVICLAIIVLTGCSSGRTPFAPNPEELRFRSVFIADGVVYAVCTDGRQTYLAEACGEEPEYRLLQEDNELHHDAYWHVPSGQLLFREGHDIYGYDPIRGERSVFWEMSGGTKKDSIRLLGASDEWLFLSIGYGERKWMGSASSDPYSYYVNSFGFLDVDTGEYAPWCRIDLQNGDEIPDLLCIDGQSAYIMQRTAVDEISVFSVELDTMRTETITKLRTRAKLNRCEGVIQEQTLHVISSIHDGIMSISLEDGMITETLLKNPSSPEHTLPWRLQAADGQIYVLAWDGVDYPTAMLCRWDPVGGSLQGLSDVMSDAADFFIDGNDVYLWSSAALYHIRLE